VAQNNATSTDLYVTQVRWAYIILYCTVLYCIVLYCTYCSVLYYIILYYWSLSTFSQFISVWTMSVLSHHLYRDFTSGILTCITPSRNLQAFLNYIYGVYPAWFIMPWGAFYSDINLTTLCRCLTIGEATVSQYSLNFCHIKRRHIPDDTTLNFIIFAGTTSRPPDVICIVMSCKFVTGYQVFGGTYKHMFRGKRILHWKLSQRISSSRVQR